MYVKLTLGERLKDLRTERGLTLEQLAQETGISKSALGNYEGDTEREVTPSNIVMLSRCYGVSSDYLLGLIETKNHPTPEQGALGLDDKAVMALQGGRMNKRLLSELLAHPAFPRLLVDMEIYVDRIASMQIQHLNAYVDMAREEIEKKYAPPEPDLHLETLKAARIDEHAYFTKAIYEDLAVILSDIQKFHEADTTTADTTPIIDQMKADMEAAISMAGSEKERDARFICKQYGVDFDQTSIEEITSAASFMNKSKAIKNLMKQSKTKWRKY